MRTTSACSVWVTLPFLAACAQIIHADFDDLKPQVPATGAAGSGEADAGQGGMGQAGTGSETGGSGGSGGTGGSADGGGQMGGADAGTDARDASADRSTDDAGMRDTGLHDSDATPDVAGDQQGPGDVRLDAQGGAVVINELEGIGDDWLELYNPGDAPFVLDGYAVAQAVGSNGPPDLSDPIIFPPGTMLDPGAYLMILGKQLTAGGPVTGCLGIARTCYTVTWGISSSAGEGMFILQPDRSIVSEVDYPAPGDAGVPNTGQTYGRIPNGTGDFTVTAPTPNAPNHL